MHKGFVWRLGPLFLRLVYGCFVSSSALEAALRTVLLTLLPSADLSDDAAGIPSQLCLLLRKSEKFSEIRHSIERSHQFYE